MLNLGLGASYGPQSALFAEMFSPRLAAVLGISETHRRAERR